MRLNILAFVVVIGGVAALLAGTAHSQGGGSKNLVFLQSSTPGISQSGHSNISGTARASHFVGGGSGLTGVNADTLDGLDSSSFLQSIAVPLTLSGSQNGSHIVGATNTGSTQDSRALYGLVSASSGTTYGVWGESSSSQGSGVLGWATAASGMANGVYGISQSTSGRGVFGSANANSGTTFGGYFRSASPDGMGVFGAAEALSGDNSGVHGLSVSPTGRGVYGRTLSFAGINYGGYFESPSNAGRGVFGLATSNSGTTYGGYFQSNSFGGRGVYGFATNTFGTGTGVYGRSDSSSGTGVAGIAEVFEAANVGVFGSAFSGSGRAIVGINRELADATPYGVWGEARPNIGVAMIAVGNSVTTGSKAFRIDHPHDPENKYLMHYCTESPFPQNSYSGNVVTDAKGKAWVELPEYFDDINANFKYQLTVVDDSESADFVQVKIARKIVDGRFLIMTSAPKVEVSWRVEADRNDPIIQETRPSDVVDKQGIERGTYQYPEHFGMPKERRLFYHSDQKRKQEFSKFKD